MIFLFILYVVCQTLIGSQIGWQTGWRENKTGVRVTPNADGLRVWSRDRFAAAINTHFGDTSIRVFIITVQFVQYTVSTVV